MSFKCSIFFENRSYFGENASGTSAVTSVIYSGNTQSLNGLARDLLAREPFTTAVICVVPALVSSLRIVISMVAGLQTAFLSANSKVSLDICIKFYSYSRIGTNENNMKIRVWTVLWKKPLSGCRQ